MNARVAFTGGCRLVPLNLFFLELRLCLELRKKSKKAVETSHDPDRNCPNYSNAY